MIHHTDESTSENVCYSYHESQFKLTAVTANISQKSAPEHAQVQEVVIISDQFAQQNAIYSKPPLCGMSAHKKLCKYGVMRTRLQCTQFLCVRACNKNRNRRKWQIWDSDHFLLENMLSVDIALNNSEHLYPLFASEVSLYTCMRTDSGEFYNWGPLYFRRFTLQDHLHDAPLPVMISIYHLLQWSLWLWSLTVSYNNCKCLHSLYPSTVLVNTQATSGLYPSQQLTIWCCLE